MGAVVAMRSSCESGDAYGSGELDSLDAPLSVDADRSTTAAEEEAEEAR